MNPEMRRVVTEAEVAARRGWSDADVAVLAAATRSLLVDENELQRVLALPIDDHGFREDVITTDPAFHASVFGLRAGETIPLHDHPELDVITKVLSGRVRVQTFEWIEAANLIARECGAVVIGDADDALVLRKAPGALHVVTAIKDTAFLDLFAPYYDDAMRPCRYYAVVGASEGKGIQLRVVSWEEARACPAPLTNA